MARPNDCKIMIDDTSAKGPVPVADMSLEMADISKHRVYRNDHHGWVIRKLKVLVYDGPQDCSEQDKTLRGQDDSGPKNGCNFCARFPSFPPKEPVRRFRLVQPWLEASWGECSHILAISYCWGPYATAPRTSMILDDTESARSDAESSSSRGKEPQKVLPDKRVPADAVLDRAVSFAAAYGLRFIWIDQACLPQDGSEEHQTGIQAMDLLYNRAQFTAGLLNDVITRQHSLGAMGVTLLWWRRAAQFRKMEDHIRWWLSMASARDESRQTDGSPNNSTPQTALQLASSTVEFLHSLYGDLLNVLELISDDQYFQRAWIFQEALTAGDKLVLQIQHEPGLSSFEDMLDINQGDNPIHVPNTVSLRTADFLELRKAASRLFKQILPAVEAYEQHVATSQGINNSERDYDPQHRFDAVMQKTERLFFTVTEPDGSLLTSAGAGSLGKRLVCNASSATTFLRDRSSLYAEDKVAIVANCCNYDVRLDIFKLATRFRSLRSCLLTLAVMNGDFSLLVRDLVSPTMSEMGSPSGKSFAKDVADNLTLVHSEMVSNSYGARFAFAPLRTFTARGFGLPAHIYDVCREVDVTPIKVRFINLWQKMTTTRASFYKIQGESQPQFEERVKRQRDLFSTAVSIPPTEPGVEVKRVVTIEFAQSNLIVRTGIATIFFAILRYLYESNETALADSIWHSIRATRTRNKHKDKETFSDLPDNVCQNLFDNPTVKFSPWDAIQLLVDPFGGTYQHLWIIERVISHGSLWVGSWVPSTAFGHVENAEANTSIVPSEVAPEPESFCVTGQVPTSETSDLVDQVDYDSDDSEAMIRYAIAMSLENKQIDEGSEAGSDQNPDKEPKGILERQARNNAHAAIYAVLRDRRSENGTLYVDPRLDVGLFVSFNENGGTENWNWKQEDRHCKRRVATFSVDGPCTVAVPYSHDLEVLPHSQLRGMKLCWKVERSEAEIEDRDEDTTNADVEKRLGEEGHISLSVEDVRARLFDKPGCTFRILDTVHGAWQIIDPCPCQIHRFR